MKYSTSPCTVRNLKIEFWSQLYAQTKRIIDMILSVRQSKFDVLRFITLDYQLFRNIVLEISKNIVRFRQLCSIIISKVSIVSYIDKWYYIHLYTFPWHVYMHLPIYVLSGSRMLPHCNCK
jgi:hypothetical protein